MIKVIRTKTDFKKVYVEKHTVQKKMFTIYNKLLDSRYFWCLEK